MHVAANRAWSSAEDCEGRSVRKGRSQKLRSGEVERQSLLAALRCARGCASATSAMPGAGRTNACPRVRHRPSTGGRDTEHVSVETSARRPWPHPGPGTLPRKRPRHLDCPVRHRTLRTSARRPWRTRGLDVAAERRRAKHRHVPRLPRPTPNTFQRKRPLAVRGRPRDPARCCRRAKHRHRASTARRTLNTFQQRRPPLPVAGPRDPGRCRDQHKPARSAVGTRVSALPTLPSSFRAASDRCRPRR